MAASGRKIPSMITGKGTKKCELVFEHPLTESKQTSHKKEMVRIIYFIIFITNSALNILNIYNLYMFLKLNI